jgi:hypothetical protein
MVVDVQDSDEKGKGKAESRVSDGEHEDGLSVAPAAGKDEEDPSDIDHGPSDASAAAKDDGTSDVEDGVEDGDVGVMSPECQDPLLAKTYLGLPVLP